MRCGRPRTSPPLGPRPGPLLTLADEGLLDGGRVDAAPMFARAAVPAGGEAQLDLDPQPQVVSTAVEATFALEAQPAGLRR